MSLKDVLDNVNFDPEYTADEIKEFKDILTDIYNTPTGKQMLEDGIADPGITFNHIDQDNNAFAQKNTGQIFINSAIEDNVVGIDENGQSFAMNNRYVITHELVHALEGLDDLDHNKLTAGSNDYEGPTERFTKTIMDEMGDHQYRASYTSATLIDNIKPGESFTNGAKIDNAIVNHDEAAINMVDGLAGTRDLVIDLTGGATTINTGNGDDFVHAREGNDTINTGADNDTIFEGQGSDKIDGGTGFDIVDYSQANADGMLWRKSSGLTVTVNGSETTVEMSVPRGMFRTRTDIDTLTNIEEVIGTDRNDTFTLDSVSGNMYIDGGQGDNTLTVTGEAAGYILDTTDGTYPAGHPRAGESYGGKITSPDGSDVLYYDNIDETKITGFTPAETVRPTLPDASLSTPFIGPAGFPSAGLFNGGLGSLLSPKSQEGSLEKFLQDAGATPPIVSSTIPFKEGIEQFVNDREILRKLDPQAHWTETQAANHPEAEALLVRLDDLGVKEFPAEVSLGDTAQTRMNKLLTKSGEIDQNLRAERGLDQDFNLEYDVSNTQNSNAEAMRAFEQEYEMDGVGL